MKKSALHYHLIVTRLVLAALVQQLLLISANASDAHLKCAYPFARATHNPTALHEYVAAPDPNYTFVLTNAIADHDCTTYIVEMTSQAWLTTSELDRRLRKHCMIIVKPKEVTSSKSFLFISGEGNGRPPPSS